MPTSLSYVAGEHYLPMQHARPRLCGSSVCARRHLKPDAHKSVFYALLETESGRDPSSDPLILFMNGWVNIPLKVLVKILVKI